MPMGCLHCILQWGWGWWESQRLLKVKESLFPFCIEEIPVGTPFSVWSCIVAVSALEIWIGLGPQSFPCILHIHSIWSQQHSIFLFSDTSAETHPKVTVGESALSEKQCAFPIDGLNWTVKSETVWLAALCSGTSSFCLVNSWWNPAQKSTTAIF